MATHCELLIALSKSRGPLDAMWVLSSANSVASVAVPITMSRSVVAEAERITNFPLVPFPLKCITSAPATGVGNAIVIPVEVLDQFIPPIINGDSAVVWYVSVLVL